MFISTARCEYRSPACAFYITVSDLAKSSVRKMADWDAEDFEPELAPKPVVK
jgi:hypothetical protein